MKKINYRKLVRDKIPKRIQEDGGQYEIRTLSMTEFKREILKKVEEEAGGLANAGTKKEIVSEMGDVMDVLVEIKKAFKITAQTLGDSRKKEFERKGGFKKKVFLVWAEDTGYRSNEKRGRK
jgi:predicted house-cleaning noncanonical NTP pyrophosphatase (MazG superfamily)